MLQRLAHRRPADTERGGQVALGRETLTGEYSPTAMAVMSRSVSDVALVRGSPRRAIDSPSSHSELLSTHAV